MGEICREPFVLEYNGLLVEAFDEYHTLADIARWICKNEVDAEELVREIQDKLEKKNNDIHSDE